MNVNFQPPDNDDPRDDEQKMTDAAFAAIRAINGDLSHQEASAVIDAVLDAYTKCEPKSQTEWDRVYNLIRYWSGRARTAEDELASSGRVPSKEASKPEGYRVFKDGAAWCAVGPGFVDLQQSPAGFAETPGEALEQLMKEFGKEWAAKNGHWSKEASKAVPVADEREAFAVWARTQGYQRDELDRCKIGIVSPEFFNLNTENAFKAWQAGRASQQQALSDEAAGEFTDWLCREMPPGTVISDPAWWAPKIMRAILAAAGGSQ